MSLIAVDQEMQRPTHPRLHIRDARDAHIVLEAVRRGLLQPIKRRLNDVERNMNICSGAVFVWEESDDETGLRRWTDSRLWSQSRMREVRFWSALHLHWTCMVDGSDSPSCSMTKDCPMNFTTLMTSRYS